MQRGLQLVQSVGTVEHRRDVGVTIVRVPEAVHDLALGSFSVGSDVVVAVHFGGRYEVTCKYTAFVELHSRPVQARLNLAPLAKVRRRTPACRAAFSPWSGQGYSSTCMLQVQLLSPLQLRSALLCARWRRR